MGSSSSSISGISGRLVGDGSSSAVEDEDEDDEETFFPSTSCDTDEVDDDAYPDPSGMAERGRWVLDASEGGIAEDVGIAVGGGVKRMMDPRSVSVSDAYPGNAPGTGRDDLDLGLRGDTGVIVAVETVLGALADDADTVVEVERVDGLLRNELTKDVADARDGEGLW